MYPLYSTTTCSKFLPTVYNPATTTPSVVGNPFQYRREVCVTQNSVQFGGSVSSSTGAVTLEVQNLEYIALYSSVGMFFIVVYIAIVWTFKAFR